MRRTRFTVTLEGNAPRVILAYTADYVRGHYEKLGYNVLSVERGDHRTKARHAAIKACGGFRIDAAALAAAVAEIGLTLPVRLAYNGRVGNTNGNYRFRGTHHAIMLKSYHTPQQATETLWHELCHAMQAERAGDLKAWSGVYAQQRRYPYSRRPIEVEARQFAAARSHRPLAVAA